MRSLYALLAFAAGCAQATQEHTGDVDANTTHTDSSVVHSDSSVVGVDSAGPCTVGTYDIVMNGSFEQMGSGWTVTPITAGDPLINTKANDGGGVDAQSPTYRAWLGGVAAASGQTVTDSMTQDIPIDASTTALKFDGYYWANTQEFTSGVFDTATVELVTTAGTSIQTIKTFDDDHAVTGWTAFTKTITANVAGQTVRLRVTSTNDDLYPTNFYFDTFKLSATYCK